MKFDISDPTFAIRHLRPVHIPLLVLVGLTSACGPRGPETVKVRGRVDFQSRAQPSVCRVFFAPLEVVGDAPLRPASATLGADGTFSATSFAPGDGLIPGKYRVLIEYFDLKPGGNPDLESDWLRQEYHAGELTVASGQEAVEPAYVVPRK
jgi:hypothetical protein